MIESLPKGGLAQPTASLLKENIQKHHQGKSIFINNTNRIGAEGKRIAANVFSSVIDEGRSPSEIREAVNEVRAEIKSSLAAHKRELRAQIEADLLAIGFQKKGNAKEFRNIVAKQLALELTYSPTAVSIAETRKVLTSINQKARIRDLPEPPRVQRKKIVTEEISQLEPIINPEPEFIAVNQTQEADERVLVIQDAVEERIKREAGKRESRLKKLGWKLVKPVQQIMAATVTAAMIYGALFNQDLKVAYAPTMPAPAALVGPPPPRPAPEDVAISNAVAISEVPSPVIASKTDNQIAAIPEAPESPRKLDPAYVSEENTLAFTGFPAQTPEEPEQPQLPEEKIDPFAETQQKIEEIAALYKKKNVEIGLSVIDINSGEQVLALNKNRLDAAASTGKLYTAGAVFDAINKGEMKLSDRIGEATIEQHLRAMINLSDNGSWKELNKKLGDSRVEQFANSHGAENYKVGRNLTTPEDLSRFLTQIYKEEIITDEQKQKLFGWMKTGTTSKENYLFKAFLNQPEIISFHKWGEWGIIADCGVVIINGEVYAVTIIIGAPNTDYRVNYHQGKGDRIAAIQTLGVVLRDGLVQASESQLALDNKPKAKV